MRDHPDLNIVASWAPGLREGTLKSALVICGQCGKLEARVDPVWTSGGVTSDFFFGGKANS